MATLNLNRLYNDFAFTDEGDGPSVEFIIFWQQSASSIEQAFADIEIISGDTTVLAIQVSTNTANISTNTDLIKRLLSWAKGATITATDAGASASIVISAHTRVYGDASTVAITGDTLTGLAFDTDYGIYYDDATLADTTPTFIAAATLSDSLPSIAADRHQVGVIRTPADGEADTAGTPSQPPGAAAKSLTSGLWPIYA